MHNRIKEIRERLYNGSNVNFAEFMNEKPNTTSNWISGTRKIGVDVVEKLKEKIPNLNLEWLFTGKGEMLTTDETQSISDSIESHLDNDSKDYLGIIKSQQKTIENLSDTINKLITK